MLRRVSGALFEAPAGAEVRVVARSQANNGVQDARFEYAGTVLDRESIQGLPGCHFTVDAARRRLQAIVVFDPSASGKARYDLFEVEPDGGLTDLEETVSQSDSSPLIDFVIEGVELAAAGPVGMARPPRPRAAAAPVRRRKPAGRAAKRTGTAKGRKTKGRKKTKGAPKTRGTRRTATKSKARKTRAKKTSPRKRAGARNRR